MPDNKRKYKITFHFKNQDEFLDGFFVIEEAPNATTAIHNILKNDRLIIKWKNKLVCVHLSKFSYIECEEVEDNDR